MLDFYVQFAPTRKVTGNNRARGQAIEIAARTVGLRDLDDLRKQVGATQSRRVMIDPQVPRLRMNPRAVIFEEAIRDDMKHGPERFAYNNTFTVGVPRRSLREYAAADWCWDENHRIWRLAYSVHFTGIYEAWAKAGYPDVWIPGAEKEDE